ncbi:Metallo-beta-lactamase superfamily [Rubrobacter radiotolerans]|uniref:MBL fold metallo-hydrolase n=1 Tax=Rubrobacter radiotolerans TaxID=42256 RepID=A0A023X412_RUBRA|nr:MBL fold metallo-hydrolase [Rubrobacter radiotolerans]AHY46941.1 Metallo-beta-lactamase superfamily [Rubrobacter radiotolerans]MDX5894346.1 MBL fold metallo-hydrolase [Rubrobacter radiotolerans]SMC05793.1 Glyoxylase, beta-lactamase superfamily II [Rubrobacter radiotolerans DSM 5868]
MAVAPSELGTQPVGEAAPVAEGIYQLKVPVPFPLVFVASYLIEGEGGWTVVDPGYDYPEAREVWELGARSLGLDLDSGVEKVVVTHLHPDHIGLARWLGERAGCPVFMGGEEILSARRLWDPTADTDRFFKFMLRHGMDEATARPNVLKRNSQTRLPDDITPLSPGEKLELGDGSYRMIHTPGHTDHHLVFHDERRRVLLGGDHLLLRITPNIGVWPDTAPSPLARYLDSLNSLRDLEADLVLPGHGPLFHDLGGRIEELLLHHEHRLDATLAAYGGREATPYAVSCRVFSPDLTDYQLRFALAETLAHVELLEERGLLERTGEDPVRHRPLSA